MRLLRLRSRLDRLAEQLERLSPSGIAVRSGALAAAIEVVTIGLHFGIGLSSARDLAFMSRATLGMRVHHGYVGAALVALAWLAARRGGRARGWAALMLIAGSALILSDLVHHFVVLWLLTGSPQIEMLYPELGEDGAPFRTRASARGDPRGSSGLCQALRHPGAILR